MTQQELSDIMAAATKIDWERTEVLDQILYTTAYLKFAEAIKPLVIKYADKLPTDVKFLLKL